MHIALLHSFEKLHSIKQSLSHDISEDEHEHMNLLRAEGNLDRNTIEKMLSVFNEVRKQYVQRIMLNTDYEALEMQENNNLHISFLSKALTIEVSNFVRFKSALNKNPESSKKGLRMNLCQKIRHLINR